MFGLTGIIEDTQADFIGFVKVYAKARFVKHPKATDENHSRALPKFQSIGNKLDMNFDDEFKKAAVEVRLDRLEEILKTT